MLHTRGKSFVGTCEKPIILRGLHISAGMAHNTCWRSDKAYRKLTVEDYKYLRSVGFNHVRFGFNWQSVEPSRSDVGTYDDLMLNCLIEHIQRAWEAGLYSVVSVQAQHSDFEMVEKPWWGWCLNDELNYPDAEPYPLNTEKWTYPALTPPPLQDYRQRYLNMLSYVVQKLDALPGLIAYQPYHFPYHQSNLAGMLDWVNGHEWWYYMNPRVEQLKKTTQPMIYKHMRNLTEKILFVDPVWEGKRVHFGYMENSKHIWPWQCPDGAKTGIHIPWGSYGEYTGPDGYGWKDIYAPTPIELGINNIAYVTTGYCDHSVSYSGHPWSYDPTYWRPGMELGRAWSDKWNVPMIQTEGVNIRIYYNPAQLPCSKCVPFGTRPIPQDRIDMLTQFIIDNNTYIQNYEIFGLSCTLKYYTDPEWTGGMHSFSILENPLTTPLSLNPQLLDVYSRYLIPRPHIFPRLRMILGNHLPRISNQINNIEQTVRNVIQRG